MTHTEIDRKAEILRRKYAGTSSYAFAQEISGLISSAEVNANDTVYADKSATEGQWNRIFWGSLEMLLGDCRDAKVTNWFKKQGVRW